MIEGVDAKTDSLDDKRLKAQFGENLFALRKKKGLTRKQLAKILNVSEVSIGSYERGLRQPNFEMLFRIAGFFEVSLDNLLGYSDVALNIKIDKYRLDRAIDLFIPIGDIWTDSQQPDFFVLFVRNAENLFQTDNKGEVVSTKNKDAIIFGNAADLIAFAEYLQREATFSTKDFKSVFLEKAEKLFTDAESARKKFVGNAYPVVAMYVTRAGNIYFPVPPAIKVL